MTPKAFLREWFLSMLVLKQKMWISGQTDTCTLTSAPLLTNSSRHRAPWEEAAAKCSGVKPLLFGWLTLAPQSISSLTVASWPWKQAKCSAVFPNALDSSICRCGKTSNGLVLRMRKRSFHLLFCFCYMNVSKCVCFVTFTARLSKCLTTVICPLEAAAWRGVYPRLSLQLISAPWATSRHTTSKWPASPEHAYQQKAAIDCSCHFCCSVGFFYEICSCGKIIDPFCNALNLQSVYPPL